MTGADRNRPFCYNSDVVRNRSCINEDKSRQEQTGTDLFAQIQMQLGSELLVTTMAEVKEQTPFPTNSDVIR